MPVICLSCLLSYSIRFFSLGTCIYSGCWLTRLVLFRHCYARVFDAEKNEHEISNKRLNKCQDNDDSREKIGRTSGSAVAHGNNIGVDVCRNIAVDTNE